MAIDLSPGNGLFPFILLGIGIIVILIVDIVKRESAIDYVATIATVTILATIFSVIATHGSTTYSNSLADDKSILKFGDFYIFFGLVGLIASLLVIFVAWRDMSHEVDQGVFFALLLLANMGGLVIASSQHMMVLLIGYELMSIPSYVMVAFKKRDRKASESSIKFFLLGALSTAILLFGVAFYYGATGTLFMGAEANTNSEGYQYLATILIAAGSGFKIGLVPFHFWIADVYSGSPSSVVTWLAVASKKMAFAFVMQLFFVGLVQFSNSWTPLLVILSLVSMLLGNIAAVIQSSVMRILAYSTVAQAGYIIAAYAAYGDALNNNSMAGAEFALRGIGLHIIAHVFMKGAAIIVTYVIIDNFGNSNLENFKGLLHKNKLLGVSMFVALTSLMGIPITLGFFGKYFIIIALVEQSLWYLYVPLLVGTAISVYYYVKIILKMIEQPEEDSKQILVSTPIKSLLVILTLITVFGFFFVDMLFDVMAYVLTDIY